MNYKKEMETNGYCIIEDVLSPKEIEYCISEFKTWQSTITDLDHDTIPHGIYQHHHVGHARHAWYIRTRPKVQDIFKSLWNCNDLITSFDGTCYISKKNKKKDTIWTHTDQAPSTPGLQCIQGFVSLTTNKERTFVVYEGSHLFHKDYFERKENTSKKPWQRIDKDTIEEMKEHKKVLHVPAGALVLWDSRCFHQNQYGKPGEERIVQYVCYLPKSHPKNTKSMEKKRRKYFIEKRTTSHWPAPIRVNSLQPNVYGDKSKHINYELLQQQQEASGTMDISDLKDEINILL